MPSPTSRKFSTRLIKLSSATGLALLAFCSFCGVSTQAIGQATSFENPPIDYLNAEVTNSVAQLITKLESGEIKLKYDSAYGYLPAVLKALDIPISSQTFVFSKTSLQLHRINPSRPRAVF